MHRKPVCQLCANKGRCLDVVSVMLLSLTRTRMENKGCEMLEIRNDTDVYSYFCLANGCIAGTCVCRDA